MKIETLHQHFLKSSGICTDTRKITSNCLFFALKGENFNGNTFAKQALEQGAYKVIVDEDIDEKNSSDIIKCDDSLTTLQKLATFHRDYLNTPIISLTGSNGKTTTKELINAVLSKKYTTTATTGNLNNHIGVPLTLLKMNKETEIGIVEMGANHIKEIAALSEIAKPNYGYITNFGKAHIEGFGSLEGVVQGKSELYHYLIKNKQHIFINADDAKQYEIIASYPKKIGFSKNNPKHFTIQLESSSPYVVASFNKTIIKTHLIGAYNFTNVCAAITIGHYFNVPDVLIKEALENYIPSNNRSQQLEKNGHKIILDAYNANPSSMMAALDNFKNIDATNKVLFLGDMFELGTTAASEHQAIADYIIEMKIDNAFLIGSNFTNVESEHPLITKVETFVDLKKILENTTLKPSTILIKASRGMALERVIDLL